MNSISLHMALIGILLTTTLQGSFSCRPRMSGQNAQMANESSAGRAQARNYKQLLEAIAQFASSDESESAAAWKTLQSHGRSKLIEDLTRIRDAAAPDDGNRALIAFTFCALGHEYASNRKIVVSALSKRTPFKNVYGDWAVTLVTRLMIQGDHDLLAPLFEVSQWSDGAMAVELASSYSQVLILEPEIFLRLLSSQPEATRNRVLQLLKFNSFTADEDAKVKLYLKNVSHQSKLRPIAEKTLRALTH